MKRLLLLIACLTAQLLSPLNSWAVFDFDVTVCASGCDYTAYSTAENALDNAGDIRETGTAKCGAWDAQAGSAIADATAVTWDSGASSGTLHHQTDAGSSGEYLLTVAAGTLDDNDIVSDGTNTFTLAGEDDSCSITVKAGAAESIADTLYIDGFTTDVDNNLTFTGRDYKHTGINSTGA